MESYNHTQCTHHMNDQQCFKEFSAPLIGTKNKGYRSLVNCRDVYTDTAHQTGPLETRKYVSLYLAVQLSARPPALVS